MYTEKQKRLDRLYLDLAERIAQESFATRSKVGALLVKNDNVLSMGWNGMPSGYDNACELPGNVTNPLVLHAELNAFMKLARDGGAGASGATLYITLSPCPECAKMIIQSRISRVVYRDKYRITEGIDVLLAAKIPVEQLIKE